MDVAIRMMIRSDLLAVLDIEREGIAPFWGEDEFRAAMKSRHCIGVVATIGPANNQEIVGFCVYNLLPKIVQVVNIGVAATHRLNGVGRCLIQRIIGKLSFKGRRMVVIDVGEGNYAAQKFLNACGFNAERVLRGVHKNEDDAYRFVFRLEGRQVFTNRISQYLEKE